MSNTKAYKAYRLSKHRYLELKHYCLQYGEKKEQLDKCYSISGVCFDKEPGGSNLPGKPTERNALIAAELSKYISLIDDTIREVAGGSDELTKALDENIKKELSFDTIRVNSNRKIPCGRQQFYEMRCKFFFILDKKLQISKNG